MPAKGPSKKTKLVTQSTHNLKKTSQRRNQKKLLSSAKSIGEPSSQLSRRHSKGNKLKLKGPSKRLQKRQRTGNTRSAKPLVLTSKNDRYRHRRGVSIARPEIIFQMNFIPGYYSNGKTKKAALHTVLDTQKSLRSLYIENNGQILERLNQEETLADEIEKILENYDSIIVGVKETIKQLGHVSDFVKGTKHYLDFKARGPALVQEYNDKQAGRTERKVESLEKAISALSGKADAARVSGGNVQFYTGRKNAKKSALKKLKSETIDNVHESLTDTGYTKRNYDNFSNTKVIGQILFDLKASLTHHSPCLIDRNKKHRAQDEHPFNIDSTIRSKARDSTGFSIEEYTGLTSVKAVHAEAIKDLPRDDTDRSRVLINELMKVSRMSISLKSPKLSGFLDETYPGSAPNNSMWDDVYGSPEDPLVGAIDMIGASSILRIPGSDDTNPVLPLENAYIRSRSGQVIYEPGSVALCDYILDSGHADATRYAGYARHFMETVQLTSRATMRMNFVGNTGTGAGKRTSFGGSARANSFGSRRFDFHGDTFFRQVCKFTQKAHDGVSATSVHSTSKYQAALLFDTCDEDTDFRYMLIRFLLVTLRKKELSENEALLEYLSKDEELSKQLEREELLASLQAPAGADTNIISSMQSLTRSSRSDRALSAPLSEIGSTALCEEILVKLTRMMTRALNKKYGKPKLARVSRQRPQTKSSLLSRTTVGTESRPNQPSKGATMSSSQTVDISLLMDNMKDPESGIYLFLASLVDQYDKFLMGAKRRVSPSGVKAARSMGHELDDQVMEAAVAVRSARAALRGATIMRTLSYGKAAQSDAAADMIDASWNNGSNHQKAFANMLGRKTTNIAQQYSTSQRGMATVTRAKADRAYGNIVDRSTAATSEYDFMQRAQEALKRNAMDAVPDIFEIDPENPNARSSRYGQIPEENFKCLWLDSVLTVIGETYDVHIKGHGQRARGGAPWIQLQINETHHNATMNALKDMRGHSTEPKNYAHIVSDIEAEYYQNQTDFFNGTENALEEERIFISKRIQLLSMFGTSIVKQAIKVNAFFDLDLRGTKPWKQALSSVIAMPGGSAILAGLNDEQLRLKHQMVESLSTNTEESKKIPVADYDKFKSGQAVFLSACLKERKFRASKADNLNVIAIGLPIGMIKDLQVGIIDNTSRISAFDPYKRDSLLRLKVWKRDQQFDDLVFAPQSFIFDHTIFLSPVDSFDDVKVGDEFKDIAKSKLKYIDYDEQGRTSPDGTTYAELRNSPDIRLARPKERYSVIKNTLYSEGLKYYIRLLTGINLDEQEFFLDPRMSAARQQVRKDKTTKAILAKIISIYLNQEGIETEAQYLANQAMIDQLTSFTQTTIFKARENALTALHPTLFDRVFCLGVDPDDFKIDQNKTMSTKSGRNALRSALRMKQVRKGRDGYYLKPRRPNEGKVAIYEYFVTADMLLGNRSIHKKRLQAEQKEHRDESQGASPWARFMDSDT